MSVCHGKVFRFTHDFSPHTIRLVDLALARKLFVEKTAKCNIYTLFTLYVFGVMLHYCKI